MFDCDEYIERKPFVASSRYTFTLRRESGRLFIDLSLMEKRAYSRPFCTDISWRSKSRASLVQRRLSFFLFFIKSAMELVVEPPMTVDLSLIVAAMTDADTCSFAD